MLSVCCLAGRRRSDFVINRFCRLYRDRIVTFKRKDDLGDHKWAGRRPGWGRGPGMGGDGGQGQKGRPGAL